MYKFLSALIGILITIMIAINGTLSSITGDYLSIVIIHIAGLISVSIVMILGRKKMLLNKKLPFHYYISGALGVILTFFNNITFISIGASLTLALGLLGQSIASIVIDHYGLMEMKKVKFKKEKIIGIIIMSLGIIIMTLY